MAKLEQDNKLLAELDQKVRTANPPYIKQLSSSLQQQANSILGNITIQPTTLTTQLHSSLPSLNSQNSNLLNLTSLASKNLLSALEASSELPATHNFTSTGLTSGLTNLNKLVNLNSTTSNLIGTQPVTNLTRQTLSQPTLTDTTALHTALTNVAQNQQRLQNQLQQQQQQFQNHFLNSSSNLTTTNLHNLPSLPNLSMNNLPSIKDYHSNEMRIAEDIVDTIEIANRGRFRVFIARYSYDPFKQR